MTESIAQTIGGLLFLVGLGVALAIPYWKICDRTGMSKWLLVLVFIPLVNLTVPWVIAFSNWPKVASGPSGPQRGIIYTASELEDFKRRR
jgi:hypothetical protein